MDRRDLEKLVTDRKPVKCDKCGGKMIYSHSGIYTCEVCENELLDDFGKVKRYLDEHGPDVAVMISEVTGVPVKVITLMLREGRIEITENSRSFIKCEKCGCSLRYGRFCSPCVRVLAGGIQNLFSQDGGERPKHEETAAKMRFQNRE